MKQSLCGAGRSSTHVSCFLEGGDVDEGSKQGHWHHLDTERDLHTALCISQSHFQTDLNVTILRQENPRRSSFLAWWVSGSRTMIKESFVTGRQQYLSLLCPDGTGRMDFSCCIYSCYLLFFRDLKCLLL